MNKEAFPPKDFENVCGGLRTKIVPTRHFAIIQLPKETQDEESSCFVTQEYDNVHWEFNDDRRHFRIYNADFLDYYPAFYPQPVFTYNMTQYDWAIHCNLHKPDHKYLQQLNQVLGTHLVMIKSHISQGVNHQVDNFSLSESLYNLKWLYPVSKRLLFVYIADFLRNQKGLKNVILENCHLRHEDGFRFLLTLALTVGDKLEALYLWHFFIKGVMPLYIGYKEDVNDPFLLTKDLKIPVSDAEKQMIWEKYLMDLVGYDLPKDYFHFFTVFLKCFTNLTKLFVHYCWLSLGQGMTLNLLGCIRNGNLRDLYILATREDMPYSSGSRITPAAWMKAKKKCPKLKVHLILMHVGANYDDNVTLLQAEMPLITYQLVTGLPIVDYKYIRDQGFDCLIKTVIFKFNSTLRKIYLEVWYPRQRVDVMLAKCLTELPLLQDFTYCGPFDKIDTIREMCEYLLNFKTNLKLMRLLVLEDPCIPGKYRDVVNELKEEYTFPLYNRGIHCDISTYII